MKPKGFIFYFSFFEVNKMDKPLIRLIRGEKRKKTQIIKIRNERVITDPTDIKKIIREYMPINQRIQIKYTYPLIDKNYLSSLKKK